MCSRGVEQTEVVVGWSTGVSGVGRDEMFTGKTDSPGWVVYIPSWQRPSVTLFSGGTNASCETPTSDAQALSILRRRSHFSLHPRPNLCTSLPPCARQPGCSLFGSIRMSNFSAHLSHHHRAGVPKTIQRCLGSCKPSHPALMPLCPSHEAHCRLS